MVHFSFNLLREFLWVAAMTSKEGIQRSLGNLKEKLRERSIYFIDRLRKEVREEMKDSGLIRADTRMNRTCYQTRDKVAVL